MAITFPFLTSYDPPGTSEGTLDPLGLYQIADQLAMQLVPAVRERMQRIRFLTAMAVGALVTERQEDDPRHRDASPYLVWEWLVVEALMREMSDDPTIWGVPGTLVTRRALAQHGYLDARSYLKTPRVFGFHGVYKRLATHLGIEKRQGVRSWILTFL
jgi:lysozyme family protein